MHDSLLCRLLVGDHAGEALFMGCLPVEEHLKSPECLQRLTGDEKMGRVARAGGKTELFAGEGLIGEKAAGPERGNDLRDRGEGRGSRSR